MRYLFAAVRLVFGGLGLAAVIATFEVSARHSVINPFNFFGYFTVQGNIIFLVVALVTAAYGFSGRTQPALLIYLRAASATYMIIVGIVYNTLLVGLEGGVVLGWSNTVLHVVIPIVALLDWLLFGDRPPLPWKRFWLVLIYPFVWLAVVLIRVGTDGMSFYPFLDFNKLGGGAVTAYCVGIAVGFALFGLAVWALSRVRILKDDAKLPTLT